jgi:hypothetical protein
MQANPRGAAAGRSINLTLTTRGLTALAEVGLAAAADAIGVRLMQWPARPRRLSPVA